jgi:hypothetical protein
VYFSLISSEAAMMRGRQNFLRWRLIFVGPNYDSCFGAPFWRLEFWGGS